MGKMSGKQQVVDGFDLDAFVGGAEDEGKEFETPERQLEPSPKTKPKQTKRSKSEQVTETVQMKITKSELASLKARVGMVPLSKWLRHHLKSGGII